MKIELDLSNREGLLRIQKEYQTALEMIEFALQKLPANNNTPELFSNLKVKTPADQYFERLGTQFTVRDLISIAGQGQAFRDRAKALIARWERKGRISLQERGADGSPNIYFKT